MTFHQTSDAMTPGGATSTIAEADFMRSWVMRFRLDLIHDPLIRLPVVGPGSGLVAALERAIKNQKKSGGASTAKKKSAAVSVTIPWVRNVLARLAGACFTMAERLKQHSNRALERLNTTEIAKIVGFEVDTIEGQLIYEALAAINLTESKVACPAFATGIVPLCMSAATLESPGFHKTELSSAARNLITARSILRLLTSFAQVPLAIQAGPRQGVERTLALIDVLTDMGVLLASAYFAEDVADLEAQIAFLSSPIITDLLTEANLLQQREEIVRDMADIRPLVGQAWAPVFNGFYSARSVKSGGATSELLLLPPAAMQAFAAHLSDPIFQQTASLAGLPATPTSSRAPFTGYAVVSPFDLDRATRSKLFEFATYENRQARYLVLNDLRKIIASTIANTMAQMKTLRDSWMYGVARRYSSRASTTLPRFGQSTAAFDMSSLTPTDPADDVPTTVATTQASPNLDKDIGHLQARPLVPAMIQELDVTNYSPLALMYSSGLPERLLQLGIPTCTYRNDVGTALEDKRPAVTLLLPLNPLFAKATALAAPEAWNLWPRCWIDFTTPVARTINLQELTSLLPGGKDDRPLNVTRDIERVAAAKQLRTLATAFAHVGVVFSYAKTSKAAGRETVRATAAAVFEALRKQGVSGFTIHEPRGGMRYFFDSAATVRPTTFAELGGATKTSLNVMQYRDAEEVERALARLAPGGTSWFLPFTHQYQPVPFDDVHLKVVGQATSTKLIDMETYELTSPLLAEGVIMAQAKEAVQQAGRARRNAPVDEERAVEEEIQRGRALAGLGATLPHEVKERAPHFHVNALKGKLRPMGGICLVPNFDVRVHHPFSFAAGVSDAPAVRFFVKRSAGSWPSPIAQGAVGSLLITVSKAEGLGPLTFASTREKDNIPTSPSDWLTLRLKPDVHASAIL